MKHHPLPVLGRAMTFLFLSTIFFATQAFSQTTVGRQKVDQYPTTEWGTMSYGLTWLPTDYNTNTSQKYPLIIFLHGAGECGDGIGGLNRLVSTALPMKIAQGWDPEAVNPVDGQNYKFIVVSPQAPGASHWSYSYGSVKWILADVMNRYRIDPTRIYVTGLSAGGAGTWGCVTNGSEFAQKIAAIVPVSAAGTNTPVEAEQLPLVGGTYGSKVWNVCGANDAWMSFAVNATNTINSANPAPAVPAIVSGIPGADHQASAWNTAYERTWRSNSQNLNIFEWMLKYTRNGATGPTPVNQLPVANAGPDQTLTLPALLQLSGSGSDVDGSIVSYSWSQVSGPTTGLIANLLSNVTSVAGLIAGTYTFRLTVKDNSGATATDDVRITISAAVVLPPPSGGGTTTRVEAENYASMQGIQTENTNDVGGGQNVGYQEDGDWMNYSVNLSSAGTYTMNFRVATTQIGSQFQVRNSAGSVLTTVTVPSTGGWQTWQTTSVQVSLPAGQQTIRIYTSRANGGWNINWFDIIGSGSTTNTPPTVNAGADQTITLPTSSVNLNGSAMDAGGSISAYAWTKVSGGSATIGSSSSASTTITGLTQGSYTFRLTATDNGGATASDDVVINVNAAAGGGGTTTRIEAENYTAQQGIQTEGTNDVGGGQNVGYQDDNDWMDYSITVPSAGTYTMNFRVATTQIGSQFQVKNANGSVLQTVTVPSTGGWQTWQTTSANVALAAGRQTVRIYTSRSNGGWNINWFEVQGGTTNPDPTPDPTPATSVKIEAENFTAQQGIQTEGTNDAGGGQNVGYQDDNDWMDYSVNLSAAGTYTMNFRVATTQIGVQFQVRNAAGNVLTTVTVPSTGGWQTWTTTSAQVSLPAGQQTLRIYTSRANGGWNINWFEINSGTATTRIASTGVTETVSTATKVAVFPNPVQDRFALSVTNTISGNMAVQVVDMGGAVRKSFNLTKASAGATQTYLSISDLPAGEYILTVTMGNWRETIKIVKL